MKFGPWSWIDQPVRSAGPRSGPVEPDGTRTTGHHPAPTARGTVRYARRVTELSPEDRLVLANTVANAQLEGHELPAEDLELAVAYLAGELDAATYEQRLLDLVRRSGPEARSA